MKFDARITGFDEFSKLLKQLPKNVENRVIQRATTKAVRSILPSIKESAPRHIDKRSQASKKYGTLKSNLRVARLRRVRKGQKGSRVSTGNAFWGFFAEMGTRHQPARPWFVPSFKKNSSKMIDILGKEIGNGVELEAKKLAKKV